MKIRISLLVAAVLFLFATPAMADSFLPNSEGNTWTYSDGSRTETSQVDATDGGWSHFTDFAGMGDQWIWVSQTSGNVWHWDGAAGTYKLVFDSDDAVGTSYSTNMSACGPETITIAAKNESVNVSAGSFGGAIRLELSNQCADAGTASIWLAPQIGVVKWEAISLIGPSYYELTSATVDGVEYPQTAPAPYTMSMTPSRDSVWLNLMPGPDATRDHDTSVTTEFVINNTGDKSIDLSFNTSQRFDIIVEDSNGNVVTQWSANKRFMQALSTETIAPGDSASWSGTVNLPEQEGRYTVRMELTAENRDFAAETSVEVHAVY